MEDLKEIIRTRYAMNNSAIFLHGKEYFQAALLTYNNTQCYPYATLTLLGLSLELFLKSFDVKVLYDEKQTRTIKTGNKNGHHLGKLFNYNDLQHKELFEYLNKYYSEKLNRCLKDDLELYSHIFIRSRYKYEYEEYMPSHLRDIPEIFNIAESLYEAIDEIFKKM